MIAGRYSLDREIGRGGSGAVWLGRDDVLGRPVALKRIGVLPGADRTDLARAEREARLTARLNHPHVVAVFDVVADSDTDHRWLVMEYVDGVDLGRLVRERGPLSPDDAAPLLWQAADALAAAHAAGIAHRDVKPSNILVDGAGQAKLTDFGIARIATDPALTQTGMVTGSPAYLAPELATGERSGQPADVWSLGATAFHLLAGRPPYEVGGNVLRALYRIVNEEPPRFEDAGWMAPLLEGTMVKDPSRRWTMKQIRDFLASRGGQAPPPTSSRVASAPPVDPDATATQQLTGGTPTPQPAAAPPPRRRRSVPLGLVLALLALLVVVAGAGLYAALQDRGPAGPAASPSKSPTSKSPSGSPSPSKSAPSKSVPAKPTAQGIEAFIRKYVDTVAKDPSASWQMLTPKFQRESGGFEKYRDFWEPARNGRVLSISPDPEELTVSYQVRFDNWDNGPGPTVLDLQFDKGRYLIDGEHSAGFEPAD